MKWTEYNIGIVCLDDEVHIVDLTYDTEAKFAISAYDHDTGETFDPGDLCPIEHSWRIARMKRAGLEVIC